MQQATVHVKYVNEPRNPKGPATVKDADGIYWKFWPNKIPLATFKPDMTYQVGYLPEEYQGKEQRTIVAVSMPDAAAPLTQIAKNGGPATMPAQTPSTIVPASSPTYTKDEMIFVCGAINSSLKNPQIDPAKITATIGIATVNMWREIWAASFGQLPGF